MSFYFNVQSSKDVSYNDLRITLKDSSIKFYVSPVDFSEPIKGTKIFIPNKSTRGISISRDEHSFSIGINVIASEDDFKLAVSTTKAIAELTNGIILPEDSDGEINAKELEEKYDQNWIDSLKILGVDMFIQRVGIDRHLLAIGCCYMQYNIGPDIHKQLDDSNELNYYNSLVSHIQNTQFFDIEKYQIPNKIATTSQDGSNRKTYVIFYPHGSQFLAQADFVVFPVENGKYELPFAQLYLIANSKFSKIDENQYTIDALNNFEYTEIIVSIENELNKIDEETIRKNYEGFSNEELDDEFNRLCSIPNARLKVFALKRMTNLIEEYNKRNISMPNATSKIDNENEITLTQSESLKVNDQVSKKSIAKKPWWKIW